mgnify:CR=1 FL=1
MLNPKTNDIPQGKDELKKLAPVIAGAARLGVAAAKNPAVQDGAKKVVGGMVANTLKDKVGGMMGGEQEQPVVNMSHDKAVSTAWGVLKHGRGYDDEPPSERQNMGGVMQDWMQQFGLLGEGGTSSDDYIAARHPHTDMDAVMAAGENAQNMINALRFDDQGQPQYPNPMMEEGRGDMLRRILEYLAMSEAKNYEEYMAEEGNDPTDHVHHDVMALQEYMDRMGY